MSRLDKFEEILNSYEGRELASNNVPFDIHEFNGFYRIDGIQYHGEVVSYDFMKDVLPEQILTAHAADALGAKDSEFRAASAPLAYAIFKALYQNREGSKDLLTEKARKNFNDMLGFGEPLIILLSKAIYTPSGQDWVFHDYAQSTQYSKKASLAGSDCEIIHPNGDALEFVQAVLDTKDDVKTVNDVLKWITGENVCPARPSMSLDKEYSYAVGLGINRGVNKTIKFSLFANIGTDYEGFAFGVRPAKSSTEQDKPKQEKEIPFRGAAAAA